MLTALSISAALIFAAIAVGLYCERVSFQHRAEDAESRAREAQALADSRLVRNTTLLARLDAMPKDDLRAKARWN